MILISADIVLYSTDCPRCAVLKKKLDAKGIQYTENHNIKDMIALHIMAAPTLSVNGELLDFSKAVAWVNDQ